MGSVFGRAIDPPTAVSGDGIWIEDSDGKRYLDGSSGAVVANIGHGSTYVANAIAKQARLISHAHGTMFTTDILQRYAAQLAPLLPIDDAQLYPVSGGSEAVETALKIARAYHLAAGENRSLIISRTGSYHGNTRGALAVSGRTSLRAPYEPWLSERAETAAPYEYRCPFPERHPNDCGAAHEHALTQLIEETGPERVAAFIAEPISGAGLGACVPPDDYWERIGRVCRRYGILVIADEVMTGFGRTGTWFACDHWSFRPDILTAGKGAASGYWPLGLTAVAGKVHERIQTSFIHGFTYSHHPAGAAAGLAVLDILRLRRLIPRAAALGERLAVALRETFGEHPHVGDIRGRGMLHAIEFVTDRSTKTPFDRQQHVAERVKAAAMSEGLLLYPSTGGADGTNGDAMLIAPPLVTSDDELEELVQRCSRAVRRILN